MKKSKILSLIMTMIMVCTLFISTQGVAKASDVPECVDGSYLTNEDSSEVTVGSMSRGVYLKSGSSTITKAGPGKIAAGSCFQNYSGCNSRKICKWKMGVLYFMD